MHSQLLRLNSIHRRMMSWKDVGAATVWDTTQNLLKGTEQNHVQSVTVLTSVLTFKLRTHQIWSSSVMFCGTHRATLCNVPLSTTYHSIKCCLLLQLPAMDYGWHHQHSIRISHHTNIIERMSKSLNPLIIYSSQCPSSLTLWITSHENTVCRIYRRHKSTKGYCYIHETMTPLRSFESKTPRRISGSMKKYTTGKWRKLHTEDHYY